MIEWWVRLIIHRRHVVLMRADEIFYMCWRGGCCYSHWRSDKHQNALHLTKTQLHARPCESVCFITVVRAASGQMALGNPPPPTMDLHQNTVQQNLVVFKLHWNAEEVIEKLNTSCIDQEIYSLAGLLVNINIIISVSFGVMGRLLEPTQAVHWRRQDIP